MKRFICITIALCLVFGSICPVFGAVQDVYIQGYNPNGNFATLMASVIANIANINTNFQNWATLTGSGGTGIGATFQDLAITLAHIDNWFAPVGSNTMGGSLVELIANIGTVVSGYLPDIPVIASYTYSFMNSNMSNLEALRKALTSYRAGSTADWSSWNELYTQAHRNLFAKNPNASTLLSYYTYRNINGAGTSGSLNRYWTYGSPLGNIALMIRDLSNDFVDSYTYRWSADLTHYNDNLTTWDSQGSTLTQVAFTPDSAIQGLYRYLAFTQRDVARLAYVFANDEELEARELAQANQEQVLDDFIDPNGAGSVSTTDLGNMTDASDGFKSNFSTNVGSSHIWDVFDNSRYNWFTQQTKNQLDTTQETRNTRSVNDDYPTPLLDNYYNEIFGIIGVDIND